MKIIEVNGITVQYSSEDGTAHALNHISTSIDKGIIYGLVGESGSGKSTLGLMLTKLLPPAGRIVSGSATVDGIDVVRISDRGMRKLRGRKIAMIFQGSMHCLNPVIKVGEQVAEPLVLHRVADKKTAMRSAREKLKLVGLGDETWGKYPHQLSGGMKQRVAIATALVTDPEIIIADEPTTALDVVTQTRMMTLMRSLQEEYQLTMVLISHDLPLVSSVADRIGIMYGGRLMEELDNDDLANEAKHPYTQGLISSIPDLKGGKQIEGIPGEPVSALRPASGCPFYNRCEYFKKDVCTVYDFERYKTSDEHYVYCTRCKGQ